MSVIRDDLDNIRIVGVAFGGAFFVAAFIFFVQAWFLASQQEDEASKYSTPMSLREYQHDQAEKLTGYGWVDREKNTVRIPIDTAKKAVVKQLNR